MQRYIDANALYEQTAKWEAEAMEEVKKSSDWLKWSIILGERTAFKHDIQVKKLL